MKHLATFLCLILLGFAVNTMAQNTVNIPDVTTPPGTVSVPVEVDFSDYPVGAFQIEVSFDDNDVNYAGATQTDFESTYSEVNATFEAGDSEVRLGWAGSVTSTFTGDLIILNFKDKDFVGVTSLTFTQTSYDPGDTDPSDDPSWLADDDAPPAVVTTSFSDGSITFVSPVPLSIWTIVLALGLIATFAVIRFYRFA